MPKNVLKDKEILIGIDPKLFTKNIGDFFKGKNFKFKPLNLNLIDEIWKRNTFKKKKLLSLPNKDVGSNYINKINR